MKTPWLPVEPLGDRDFAEFRRRAIFDCNKWDPQVGDACVIARQPLVISEEAWRDVVGLASALARETSALETALVARPDLHRRLGLPGGTRKALRSAQARPSAGSSRLVRFDFHFTTEGWRISEANADVPGGLNEASGFAPLVLPFYPDTTTLGDPAGAYAESLASAVPPGGAVALVHATSYSDDQQMMSFVAKQLAARGIRSLLASPANLRWSERRAFLDLHGETIRLEPVLGRVGEGIGVRGVVESRDWKWICRSASFFPIAWIAQKRFDIVPIDVGGVRTYPCLGVYTIDARVVGAYGRVSAVPLIDSRAQDAAVLTKAA